MALARALAYILLLATIQATPAPALAAMLEYEGDSPLVAVYFYVWYGPGGRHWGDSAEAPILPGDAPVIGFYSSINTSVIEWQLSLVEEAGIDALFVSWRGPGSYEDSVLQRLFKIILEHGYRLRVAVVVEPYLGDSPRLYNETFWNKTLSYIWREYASKYSSEYLELNGKPLVLALSPVGESYTPRGSLFTIRIVGACVDASKHVDWDLWPDYLAPWTTVKTPELRVRSDGYVAIAPRFDDRMLCIAGARRNCSSRLIDPAYLMGAYVRQWRWVIGHRDSVGIVAIYSWNNYHVRSMIEPHYDATASVPGYNPYTLYNTTKYFIAMLKNGGSSTPASSGDTALATAQVLAFIIGFSTISYYLFELRYRTGLRRAFRGYALRALKRLRELLRRARKALF